MPIQLNGTPYFSIMVPTYNQAHYLPSCLNSLISQSFSNWEAVVVNDGSTDETSNILEKWASKDPRIRVFHQKNAGTAGALNTALSHCKGQWVCWLSSDDLFEPDKLEIQRNAIKNYPDIRFFYTHFYHLEESTGIKTAPGHWRPIPEPNLQVARFFSGNYISGITVCIQRQAMLEAEGFRTDLRQGQDFAFWLTLSRRCQFHFIDRRTVVSRWHDAQTTNGFPVGGLYDSAWACIEFLNAHSFEAFFPIMDLDDPKQAKIAVDECMSICLDPGSFIYQLGYSPALLQRLLEWLHAQEDSEGKKAGRKIFENTRKSSKLFEKPDEIQKAFQCGPNRNGTYRYIPESVPDFIRRTIALPSTQKHKKENLIRYLDMKGC